MTSAEYHLHPRFQLVTDEDMKELSARNAEQFGERRVHRKEITVPAARKRAKQTPWSKSTEMAQWEARRELRKGNPFIVWDGEGCNAKDGTMSYVLLGHTSGQQDSSARFITGERLDTVRCLKFIWDEGQRYKGYFHVSFGFNFDVDQILRDVPDDQIQVLKDTNELDYRGYHLFYIPRKIFTVAYNGRQRVTIYDTISFFNTNLINTARLYVPDKEPLIQLVEKGKAGRSSFDYSELRSIIIPYWNREGELMKLVMNALRHSLTGAGITLEKWHGPGAIAEALIKREGLAPHIIESRVDTPNEVIDATAYAFFGGRFECRMIGHIKGPIYSYDIRSAYPYGLTKTPALSGGHWERTTKLYEDINGANGIYHVQNKGHKNQTAIEMGPLPYRTEQGLVIYPYACEGWYFGPEIIAAKLTGWDIEILDGWVYVDGDPSPFLFLEEMYLQRAEFKREHNPAELACNLGFNSIYGKLAQLVGWDQEHNMPPKFHHQWYAGMTTSYTRARLWMAISEHPESVVAVETDGIYTREPITQYARIGHHLGDWEKVEYDEMVYIQSGMYFGKHDGKWDKARTRGISKGDVTIDDVLIALPTLTPIVSTQHRYGSLTGSLGSDKRFTWYDQESEVQWGFSEKRDHLAIYCKRCIVDRTDGMTWTGTDMHYTTMRQHATGMSYPRLIPWVDKCRAARADENDDETYEEITNGGVF